MKLYQTLVNCVSALMTFYIIKSLELLYESIFSSKNCNAKHAGLMSSITFHITRLFLSLKFTHEENIK